jgi:hypothetical protein
MVRALLSPIGEGYPPSCEQEQNGLCATIYRGKRANQIAGFPQILKLFDYSL